MLDVTNKECIYLNKQSKFYFYFALNKQMLNATEIFKFVLKLVFSVCL